MVTALCLWLMTTLDIDRAQPVQLTGAEVVSTLAMLETKSKDGEVWADAMIRCIDNGGITLDNDQEWTLESYLRICEYIDLPPYALLRD